MKKRVNDAEINRNLRLRPLNYSKNKNSFWRFEIFKNFNRSFKLGQFKDNLEYLDRLAKKDKRYLAFSKFYSRYWGIYEAGISDFSNTYVDSETMLSKTILFEKSPKRLSFRKVRELVKSHLVSSIKPWVIISNDHRVSHATIRELASRSKGRAALIVIDNHADIYGPAPAKDNPLKFNPFRNLIELEVVEHVFFLCPSFRELLNNKSSWKDIESNVSFIPIASSEQGARFNEKTFETEFVRTVREKSIESIYFSVDIDVLAGQRNSIYSAFEYSILNSILYLSLLSRKQVKRYECLSACSVDLAGVFSKEIRSPAVIQIRNPYKPGFNTVNESGITPRLCCDTIQKVAEISKKAGLTVGLGSCVGEVVELMGPDWRGKTTEATIRIVNSLNKAGAISIR